MVEPIKHNASSSIATTGWETVKGGVGGALIAGAIGAAVAGGVVGGLVALASIPAALMLGTAAAIVGGTVGLIAGAAPGGAIGAVVGFFSGRSRVARENEKYEARAAVREGASQQQEIAMAGLQQGYTMGFQQGQQKVISDIQAMQQEAAKGSHADNCGKCAGESKVEAVTKQREAQAASGQQIG